MARITKLCSLLLGCIFLAQCERQRALDDSNQGFQGLLEAGDAYLQAKCSLEKNKNNLVMNKVKPADSEIDLINRNLQTCSNEANRAAMLLQQAPANSIDDIVNQYWDLAIKVAQTDALICDRYRDLTALFRVVPSPTSDPDISVFNAQWNTLQMDISTLVSKQNDLAKQAEDFATAHSDHFGDIIEHYYYQCQP